MLIRICILFVLAVPALSGCSGVLRSFVCGSDCNSLPANNFLKTQILAQGPAPADGLTPIYVIVQLKNSNNNAVPNYIPTYRVLNADGNQTQSGVGVHGASCTTSDSNGVSVCILTSTVPGSKSFELTNALVGLSASIKFGAPTGISRSAIDSGGFVTATSNQGSIAQMNLGAVSAGVKASSPTGYTATLSLQGIKTK